MKRCYYVGAGSNLSHWEEHFWSQLKYVEYMKGSAAVPEESRIIRCR